MTRWITQEKFYNKELDTRGNCEQCAVASLLGLSLNDVPNFIEVGDKTAESFWDSIDEFFENNGFWLAHLSKNHRPPVYYLASGPAERGVKHTVVMFKDELIHDPHPSRAGLIEITMVRVPVPIDVAKIVDKNI